MAMATVVIVGLFEPCRMVLMVMWGVCTSLLVFAVDFTLTLNDQLSLMEDRSQVSGFVYCNCFVWPAHRAAEWAVHVDMAGLRI